MTSATRLFDVPPLIATDPRIQVLFTCTGSSPFTPGTAERLADLGVMPIEWAQAERTRFDLPSRPATADCWNTWTHHSRYCPMEWAIINT